MLFRKSPVCGVATFTWMRGKMTTDETYQSHLDDVATSILTNDFNLFAANYDLPFLQVTGAAQGHVTTLAGLAEIFDGFVLTVALQKVTSVLMLVDFSEMVTPELIIGTHFTHLLVGATRLCQPILCQKTLVRYGSVWRSASAALRVGPLFWPGRPAGKHQQKDA